MPHSVFNTKSVFYRFNQGNLRLNDYREKYSNIVNIATSYGGDLHDESLAKSICKQVHKHENLSTLSDAELAKVNKMAHDRYIACGFLVKADPKTS